MSQALWCDTGNHPFSAADENKRQFTERRTVRNGTIQQEVTATIDICGQCADKSFGNPNRPMIDKGTDIQDKSTPEQGLANRRMHLLSPED